MSRVEPPTRTKGPPFVPVDGSTWDKRAQPFLSRVVTPTGTKGPPRIKGPFYPGWCYQPGQKAPPRDSSKGSYSILSHVYYLCELARKSCVRQEVLESNPVVCKKNFNGRHLLSRFCHPGQKPRGFCPGSLVPVPKPGQKGGWQPGQQAICVVVTVIIMLRIEGQPI